MSDNVSIVEKKNCTGCSACFNACPVSAVSMEPDEEGFLYPVIDSDKCINCGLCVKKCPACNMPAVHKGKKAYAAYAKSEDEHKASTSGAVFALLAEYFLAHDGYICGAAFDESLHLRHVLLDRADGLPGVRGTKYVQSEIGQVYRDIEHILVNGKKVLFCGTPCQAAGLKQYLGKEYPGLVIMDLICHGVPSPMVFSKYLGEIWPEGKIVKAFFRSKQNGTGRQLMQYFTETREVLTENYNESLYIKGFIQNLSIRPVCFNCRFKGIQRCSDITIGDFWGVNDFHPEMVSDLGTSAVIAHTDKGTEFIEAIQEELFIQESSAKNIARWNECLLKPVDYNPDREVFFGRINDMSLKDNIAGLVDQKKSVPAKRSVFDKVKDKLLHR